LPLPWEIRFSEAFPYKEVCHMSHMLRVRSWLLGSTLGLSLLGACAPEESLSTAELQASEAHAVSQDLSAGTSLKELSVTLSADKTSVRASESALVKVSFHQSGRSAAKLLKWYTPADGVEEPVFAVTREGTPVAYEGAHYKRPAAQEADYVTLSPGSDRAWTVDLADVYDLSKTGLYSIRFAVAGPSGELRSNELSLWIEGRPSAHAQAPAVPQLTSSVSFLGCDSTQQATLTQALSAASTYANGAVTYLGGTPSATARYTTWFGAYSITGWNTAATHFAAIKDVYDTKPVTLDCGCRKKYYAYVYPNQPYHIYLCNVFWTAPLTGTDSKGGTLIHETSHFTVVAGTDDWVYGQSGAKSMALTDPAKALDNADTHEYFAENNPAQQ
jgi:peptidyl-Lys metalloendopeptidase